MKCSAIGTWRSLWLTVALTVAPAFGVQRRVGAADRAEARLFRRRSARHVAMADQVGGRAWRRIPAGASWSSASRARRWVRCSSTTTSRAPARPTSSWFLHGATPGRFPLTEIVAAALSRRQRRDRHQGAQRSRAAREISRCRAPRREGAAAAHAPARQRAHHQEADPHHRRHEGHAAALCLADDPRFRRGARRHAGRRGGDRAGRAAAEGHDRRHVHRLRRRRHRVQDGRPREVFDRDVFLHVELRAW